MCAARCMASPSSLAIRSSTACLLGMISHSPFLFKIRGGWRKHAIDYQIARLRRDGL